MLVRTWVCCNRTHYQGLLIHKICVRLPTAWMIDEVPMNPVYWFPRRLLFENILMAWKHIRYYWLSVRLIQWSPRDSPKRGPLRQIFGLSFIRLDQLLTKQQSCWWYTTPTPMSAPLMCHFFSCGLKWLNNILDKAHYITYAFCRTIAELHVLLNLRSVFHKNFASIAACHPDGYEYAWTQHWSTIIIKCNTVI